jgi:hypothetical protein
MSETQKGIVGISCCNSISIAVVSGIEITAENLKLLFKKLCRHRSEFDLFKLILGKARLLVGPDHLWLCSANRPQPFPRQAA